MQRQWGRGLGDGHSVLRRTTFISEQDHICGKNEDSRLSRGTKELHRGNTARERPPMTNRHQGSYQAAGQPPRRQRVPSRQDACNSAMQKPQQISGRDITERTLKAGSALTAAFPTADLGLLPRATNHPSSTYSASSSRLR